MNKPSKAGDVCRRIAEIGVERYVAARLEHVEARLEMIMREPDCTPRSRCGVCEGCYHGFHGTAGQEAAERYANRPGGHSGP